MKKIVAFLLIALFFLAVMAQSPRANRRMIVNTGTKTVVYDVSRVDSVTFERVEPVNISLELVSVAGFSVKVKVDMPDGCKHYQMAAIPASEQVGDTAAYVCNNAAYDLSQSGEVELGGLAPETDYIVAAVAYDRFGMLSGVTTMPVRTVEATEAEWPKVGYILYADGSWSRRMVKGRTPIGIIFSTSTSADDQARGWTHGYALALRNAATQVQWSVANGANQAGGHYTSLDSLGFQTDKDGYAHTIALMAQGQGRHPAAAAAVAYDVPAPVHASGWYLPSSGQWFDICVNLGGMSAQMPRLGNTEGYWNDTQAVTNCLNRINEYMSLTGAANYEPIKVSGGDYLWFWASSESSEEQAYAVFFDQDQLVVEIAPYFKTYGFASNRARAVIAF